MSKDFLENARGVLGSSADAREATRERLQLEMKNLRDDATRAGTKLEDDDNGIAQYKTKQALVAASKMRDLEAEYPKGIPEAELTKLSKEQGYAGVDEFKDAVSGVSAAVQGEQRVERQAAAGEIRKRGKASRSAMAAGGFIDKEGKLSAAAKKKFGAIGTGKGMGGANIGEQVAANIAKMAELQTQLTLDAKGNLTNEGFQAQKQIAIVQKRNKEMMGQLSTSEREAMGEGMKDMGMTGEGARMLDATRLEKRLGRARGPGGRASAIAGEIGLGGQLTKKELLGTSDEVANRMVGKSGLKEGSDDAIKLKESIISALKETKDPQKAGGALQDARSIAAKGLEEKKRLQEEGAEKKKPSYKILEALKTATTETGTKIVAALGKTLKISGNVITTNSEDVTNCFPGYVKVLMGDGSEKAIQDVRPGDEVVSVDTASGTPIKTTVLGTENHLLASDIIEVAGVHMTPNHPVWTGRAWVLADCLELGNKVYRMRKLWAEPVAEVVDAICRVRQDVFEKKMNECIVYNIRVSDFENYIAGGLLVSQNC